jgi:hypothetical protein
MDSSATTFRGLPVWPPDRLRRPAVAGLLAMTGFDCFATERATNWRIGLSSPGKQLIKMKKLCTHQSIFMEFSRIFLCALEVLCDKKQRHKRLIEEL